MSRVTLHTAIILAVALFTATAGIGSALFVLHAGSANPSTIAHGHVSSSDARSENSSAGSVRSGSPVANDEPASKRPLTHSATQWAVANTLVIFNNSLVSGNFPVPLDSVAVTGMWLAYDNLSGEIYIGDFGDSISVVSDTTNEVVDLFEPLATTGYLTSIAYDYKDNEIFTEYTGSPGAVAVTSAATNTLVATIPIGDVNEYNINGLAYDSGLGEVFASNGASSNISVISTATNSVVDWINLNNEVPQALAYDSGTHQIFAANIGFGENVSVISDTTNTPVDSIGVGTYPTAIAYDGGTGEVFVSNLISGNVTVINDTTDTVVASIPLGVGEDEGAAYDPTQHEVYFAGGSQNESVVSDATNTVVTTVLLAEGPALGAAYDSGKGEVWVLNGAVTYASAISDSSNQVVENVLLSFTSWDWAYDTTHQEEFLTDSYSSQVAVVSDTTDHVVSMVQLPGDPAPFQVVYDSGKGEVFTADVRSLSVINDTTNTVVDTIPLPGVSPTGMAYDPAKGEIFVGNEGGGNNVTIVSDATNTIVGVVPNVGIDPWSLAYDRGKGEIFAANLGFGFGASNVTVINDTTDTIVTAINVGTQPQGGLVYDSGKGEIFVLNYGSDNVSVISDATNTVVATISTGTAVTGAAYDPAADEIFVGNFNWESENVTVISDVTDTTVGSIFPDGETPSSLAFDPVTGDLYSGDSVDGTVSVITPQGGSPGMHYPVTFVESGLPAGSSWSVTFNGTLSSSTTNSIGYSVLDGAYTYTVGTVTGYVANVSGGPVSVSGAGVLVNIGFSSTGVPTYTVTFTETGLPSGTEWSVTFNAVATPSVTSTIQYSVPNGAYSYTLGAVPGYIATPSTGSVTVNSADQTVDISFSAPPVTYLVTFTETGLTTGTSWSVTLAGVANTSTGLVITFTLSNGMYSYQVGSVSGYSSSPGSGSVTLAGVPQTVQVVFTASAGSTGGSSPGGFLGFSGSEGYLGVAAILALLVLLFLFLWFRRPTYPVVFAETGLPPGQSWTVAVDGTAKTTVEDTITFEVRKDTHAYSVGPVTGFGATPASGTVDVDRETPVVPIKFSPTGPR